MSTDTTFMPDQLTLVRSVHDERCAALHARYGRCLSLGDSVNDRWTRAEHLRADPRVSLGAGVSIYDSATVFFAAGLTIGEGTWIGPNVLLDAAHAPLAIGAWCTVCANVQVYTHDSIGWALTGGAAPYESKPTTIGDRCHLGPNVVIAKGVTVGSGCVILANSFVGRDVPSGLVVAGAPAKPIRRAVVDHDTYRFEPLDDAHR